MIRSILLLVLGACLPTLLQVEVATAETKLCIRKRTSVRNNRVNLKKILQTVTDGECGKKFVEVFSDLTGPTGAAGAQGPTGPAGPTGADGIAGLAGPDGQLKIYGDGGDGNLTVSSNTSLTDGKYQFGNVVIDAGITLTIASGTIIRTTGTFTNNGNINVGTYAEGSSIDTFSSESQLLSPAFKAPGSGITASPAGFGEFGDNTGTLSGGTGATGISPAEAINVLSPGPLGGGGGAGINGGDGGGTLLVLSSGAITNASTGTINANGANASNGSGGGAGGVLVLASATSVTNDGNLNAKGGTGGIDNSTSGPGGGGGGGIINLIAPSVTDNGTISLSGGANQSAAAAGSVSSVPRIGGGGGGASAGNGGSGGAVNTDGSTDASTSGSAGVSNLIESDPTALF